LLASSLPHGQLIKPAALWFDLDGTLVDSAPDLVAALEHVRESLGLDPAPAAKAAPFVSAGAMAMLRAGLPPRSEGELEPLRERFLHYYAQHICVHSRLYPGASKLLQTLNAQGIAWGIITNKPEALASSLIAALDLHPAALYGGDSLAQKKPHPAPILAACAALGLPAEQTWMIGDDPRDIEAGRRAGCARTFACSFGYLGDTPPIADWGASQVIDSLDALTHLLGA
jgi:N-acetyl-D-muramate 6-phosphate phosphatase